MYLFRNMQALIQHIREINEKTQAWVAEDPESRLAFLVDENLDRLADRGITTPEEFDLSEARTQLWDYYKEIHGIRPRWMNVWEMSMDEVQAELDSLSRSAKYFAELEREAEEAALAEEEATQELLAAAATGGEPLTQTLPL